MARELTIKQRAFCREYLQHRIATRAAIAAGYSPVTAHVTGPRLLRKTQIAAWLRRHEQQLEQRHEVTMDAIVQRLAALGFGSVLDVCRLENGKWVVDTEAPRERFAAVKELRINADGSAVVKMHDATKALVALGVHLGGFVRRSEQLEDEPPPVIDRVAQLGPVECARRIAFALAAVARGQQQAEPKILEHERAEAAE